MSVAKYLDGCILVDLSCGPEMADEIDEAAMVVEQSDGCDVILNFSNVTVITSPSLAAMVRLQHRLNDWGRNLVIFGMSFLVRGILGVSGIERCFECAEDERRSLALMNLLRGAKASSGDGIARM